VRDHPNSRDLTAHDFRKLVQAQAGKRSERLAAKKQAEADKDMAKERAQWLQSMELDTPASSGLSSNKNPEKPTPKTTPTRPILSKTPEGSSQTALKQSKSKKASIQPGPQSSYSEIRSRIPELSLHPQFDAHHYSVPSQAACIRIAG
jgi:hypothetical protein